MISMVFGLGSDDGDENKIPTDRVEKLSNSGYTEHEILKELKKDGYSNKQINNALNQVLKNKVSSRNGEASNVKRQQNMNRGTNNMNNQNDNFVAPPPPQNNSNYNDSYNDSPPADDSGVWDVTEEEVIDLEELIEEMIEERWKKYKKHLDKKEAEREELDDKIETLKRHIEKIENKHEEEKENLKEKMDATFTHIKTIETRIGSVEKAFKEFLPSLTNNVRSLGSIVEDLKSHTGLESDERPRPPPEPNDYIRKQRRQPRDKSIDDLDSSLNKNKDDDSDKNTGILNDI